MSLTSHIKSTQSPIGQFLRQRFTQTTIITNETNAKLRSSNTVLPAAHPWPYDKIGTAIDYRIRYSFAVTPYQKLVAWLGAGVLISKPWESEEDIILELDDIVNMPVPLFPDADGGISLPAQGPYSAKLILSFFEEMMELLSTINPVGRRLTPGEEQTLARYCFVLALFEEVYREGIHGRVQDGPLLVPAPKRSVDELLAIVEDAWVDDLCQLSTLFYDTYHHLLSRPYILNPDFAGSRDVGGADADLIVDGCLIDIKTSKQPEIKPDALRQLVGYTLLDYNDEHHINSVGIYMSRQGLLFTWPIADFLRMLSGNDATSVKQLRQEFSNLCKSARARRR